MDKYGCELIGAKLPSINAAEDRELFRQAMVRIGLKTPPSGIVESMGDADRVQVYTLLNRQALLGIAVGLCSARPFSASARRKLPIGIVGMVCAHRAKVSARLGL